MSRTCLWLKACCWLVVVSSSSWPVPADERPDDRSTANSMSNTIAALVDGQLAASWKQHDIPPAKLADNATFLRRAYLDLIGTVPTPVALREFLDDEADDKRLRLVDQLLADPRHTTHLANTWRHILLPDGTAGDQLGAIGMQEWLRDQFVNNARFDRLVGNFLTVTGGSDTGPVVFYRLNELQPEKLAAATARHFLGIQLQCAQCHDHPFVDTTQEEFWQFAAFFARVRNRYGDNMSPLGQFSLYDAGSGEVVIPETEDEVPPQFPGNDEPPSDLRGTRRQQLSLWMASTGNPYLAPATVNRVWSLLFGRGLVEPVDDLGPHNPGEHPELLAQLSAAFVADGYDLRELFRGLAQSEAYGRASADGASDPPPASSFAAMGVKTLTADQLYDALQTVLRIPKTAPASNPLLDPARQSFLTEMEARRENRTRFESSVQQTLFMMNGAVTEGFVNQQSGLLTALAAPYLDDAARVDLLFAATLSRAPTQAERELCGEQLQAAAADPSTALADILWSLVNCAEFRLNH